MPTKVCFIQEENNRVEVRGKRRLNEGRDDTSVQRTTGYYNGFGEEDGRYKNVLGPIAK